MNLLVTEKARPKSPLEIIKCDLCGSSDSRLKFTARNSEFNEPFNLVECHNCGLVYLNPRPTRDRIGRYYPEENYYAYQDLDSEDWNNFRQKVKSFILECQPGYAQNLTWLRRIVWSWFKRSLMVQVPYQKGGRILDVGCGNGFFLKWMQKHGWETHGVEISKAACQVAQRNGLEVFNGELQQAKFPPGYFDAITISQVLEHLHSPGRCLKECQRILKRRGRLIVGVPNLGSFEARLYQQHWFELDVPRHLYFFTAATLNRLLSQSGFRTKRLVSKTFGIPVCCKLRSTQRAVEAMAPSGVNPLKILMLFRFIWALSAVRFSQWLSPEKRRLMGVYLTAYTERA